MSPRIKKSWLCQQEFNISRSKPAPVQTIRMVAVDLWLCMVAQNTMLHVLFQVIFDLR